MSREQLDMQLTGRISALIDIHTNFLTLLAQFENQVNSRQASNEVSMVSSKHIENLLASPAPGANP